MNTNSAFNIEQEEIMKVLGTNPDPALELNLQSEPHGYSESIEGRVSGIR